MTERSLYRYFPGELEAHLVDRVQTADPGLTPIESLPAALGTADEVFRSREFLLRRAEVIAANPALAERNLIKLTDIADALARALGHRGVEPGEARFLIDVALSSTWRWRFPGAPHSAGWPSRTRASPSSSPRPPPSWARRSRRSAESAAKGVQDR